MSLWIGLTLAAAAMQTLRFVLQKRLQGGGLSSAGATFARFLFAAPLACLAALILLRVTGAQVPPPEPAFWACMAMGGVAQIIATDLTVPLFQMRNFAVGVAFTKTETVQVAIFSLIVLAENITALALVSILAGLAGIMLLSRPVEPGAPLFGPAAIYGLAAGALLALAAVGYRGATLGVDKTWGSCGAFADRDCQATIEDSGSGNGNAVSTFGRPPHPSTLPHAGIGNVIDQTFCARRRDQQPTTIAAPIAHKGLHIVREVNVKRLATCLHTRGSGSNSQRFFREAVAIGHEPFQIGFCDPGSAVPQPPARACGGSIKQHPLA
jgi:hypothetical protein